MRYLVKGLLFGGILMLNACAGSSRSEAEEQKLLTVKYRCAGGEEVVVEYDNSNPDHSVAYVQLQPENPEKIKMTQAISASGARYTDGKLVWWTKGNSAFLTEADSAATVIYNDCNTYEEIQ